LTIYWDRVINKEEVHMSTVASEIKFKIENNPGRFWKIQDFAPFPAGAVAKALSRFLSVGLLKRYGKGLYYKPKKTILGEAPPAVTDLIKNKARDHRFVLANLSAFHKLGLTTQVPSKTIFAADSPLIIQGAEVVVRKIARYGNVCDELIMTLDALGHIEKIPDCTFAEAIKILVLQFEKNILPFTVDDLAIVSMHDRPKVRAMTGLLGDMTNKITNEYRTKLKASLNPLTRFKIGKSSKDLNPTLLKEWQID